MDHTDDTDDTDDTELETLFRDGLRRRAEEAQVPPDLVDRVAPRRRHRRLGVLVAVAAAAAVAVVAVGVDLVRDSGGSDPAVSDRGVTDSTSGATPGWRTESWHALQVSVPADWGWGAAPVVQNGQEYLCGAPGAVIAADGSRPGGGGAWVGRPVTLSDACQGGDVLESPTAPYVWLGADIPAGTVQLGNGYTQQTVDVQGTTLTVGTDDAALRQRIIGSATRSHCPATMLGQLSRAYLPPGARTGRVAAAHVCVYQRTEQLDLVYAEDLPSAQAAAIDETAVADAGTEGVTGPPGCTRADEVAVIHLGVDPSDGSPGVDHTVVANLGCGWISVAADRWTRLLPSTTTALTHGTGLPVVLNSLIGPQG